MVGSGSFLAHFERIGENSKDESDSELGNTVFFVWLEAQLNLVKAPLECYLFEGPLEWIWLKLELQLN